MFTRVAIIGCGLIGSSFALALRGASRVEIAGFDRDEATGERARSLGILDRLESSIEDAIDMADLVVIAAPVAQSAAIFEAIAPTLLLTAVVTDVGSTKRDVIAAARDKLGDAVGRFVPGHPIAGREVHGPESAEAGLFRGKRVLLTPLPESEKQVVANVAAAWTACGARVQTLTPEAHDRALSSVSHLPHLLAYVLVAQIAEASDAELKFGLAGSGFRDFTRIAASSPEMWRDITMANRDALMVDLERYQDRLEEVRAALRSGDRQMLEALFAQASIARNAWTGDR